MSVQVHSTQGSVIRLPHRTGSFVAKKHHRKPFRRRHVLLAAAMYGLSIVSGIGLGVLSGRFMTNDSPQTPVVVPRETVVSQPGVYRFAYITSDFQKETYETDQLKGVQLRPHAAHFDGRVAATQLTIGVSDTALSNFTEVAPKSDDLFEVKPISQEEALLAGVPFTTYSYSHKPLFAVGAENSYSRQWVATIDNKTVAITLDGLVGSADTPGLYNQIFETFEFSNGPEVLGTSISDLFTKKKDPPALTEKYVADAISPAVVKIYNVVCGEVFIRGVQATQEGCHASVGSGFYVSSDGYIATNGHVVIYEAADAFVQLLLADPALLMSYLQGRGVQNPQAIMQRPEALASLIGEIYTLPPGTIEFKNRQHTILVAQGTNPLAIDETTDLHKIHMHKDSKHLLKAKLIASDFSARDIYSVNAGDEAGFSSSDVALLKVNQTNTPFIRSTNNTLVTQNQAMSLLGFPADAENALIDNSQLAVTITNGTIGSIRTAAGSGNTLFQSDADASQGSSGGPAITADGKVFGLLTYRFKSDTIQDAAKSYIRDFADIKQLALQNGVSFSQTGTVQADWEEGLRWYANGNYTEALALFQDVQAAFPSHRLVSQYIASTEQAIESGQDTSAFTINLLAIGFVAGIFGTIFAVVLIVRHHGRHKVYTLHLLHLLHKA